MRSFDLLFWLVFILIYVLVTFGALKSILVATINKYRKSVVLSFLLFSLFVFASLLLMYVWPGDVRTTNKYALYFIFNGILMLDLVIKIPLFVFYLIGIFFSKNRRKIISWMGIILSGSLLLILIQGMFLGKKNFDVKQVELEFENLPAQFDNYKIVQISDLHMGSFISSKRLLRNVGKQVEKYNPDMICFTGDLVNNFSHELEGWGTIFKKITNDRRSFSILGNHDYGNYSNWDNEIDKEENFESLVNAHKLFGFQLLRNQSLPIIFGTDTMYVVGVENWGHPPFPQYANLDTAMVGIPENAFEVLLTHDPAHWESQIAGKKDIELTLSGHTHGLQFGAKPAGIPISLSYMVRKNWGGLYKSNHSYLYVNLGLGTVGIPWRIEMPGELSVITLKRVEID